jgi:hypothetical protein
MHHKVYNTQEAIKRRLRRRRRRRLGGWSGRYYLWAVSDRSLVYGKPASIKEHQNE